MLVYTSTAPAGQPTKRPTDLDRGQELWDRHCWQCHGATNEGNGPATASLVHTVPNLVDRIVVSDELARLVLRGIGAMPGYEQSFDLHDESIFFQNFWRKMITIIISFIFVKIMRFA